VVLADTAVPWPLHSYAAGVRFLSSIMFIRLAMTIHVTRFVLICIVVDTSRTSLRVFISFCPHGVSLPSPAGQICVIIAIFARAGLPLLLMQSPRQLD
jgi:hypothetical protein